MSFFFRVEQILRLLSACHLLSQLGNVAHMKCTSSIFSITVSSYSLPHYIATIRFDSPFFAEYSLTSDSTLTRKISLRQFRHYLREAMNYSSMRFTLPHNYLTLQRAYLTFNHLIRGTTAELPVVHRDIWLSQPEHEEDLGQINYGIVVSIDSKEFKRIIKKFRHINSGVRVTLTNSQVKFSALYKVLILTTAARECKIEGVGAGETIPFPIGLSPTTFFYDLTSRVERVWLYHTNTFVGVIVVPIDSNVRFEIYFRRFL